jgi:hypothetical protein
MKRLSLPLEVYIFIIIIIIIIINGFCLENKDFGCRESPRADHATFPYLQKLAPISPTSGGRSVGIVHLRTKTTELLLLMALQLFVSLSTFFLFFCSYTQSEGHLGRGSALLKATLLTHRPTQ